MKAAAEKMENAARTLEKESEGMNAYAAETRLQFDTLVQLQMQERQAIEKRHSEETKDIRKHYGRIIAGLIITLMIIMGGIVGTVVHIFSTYELIPSFEQTVTASGNGDSVINDGITYDGN